MLYSTGYCCEKKLKRTQLLNCAFMSTSYQGVKFVLLMYRYANKNLNPDVSIQAETIIL